MKKFLVILLKYVLAFGIAGFLIWLSLKGLSAKDKTEIKSALLGANHLVILPIFILLMLSHWIRSVRWQQMITPMGYKPPVFDLLCALLIGYIINQIIPRAGEIVRCTVVAKQQKIPLEKLIGTVITERVIDFLCLIILCVSMFFMEYVHIKQYAFEIFTSMQAWILTARWSKWILVPAFLIVFLLLVYFIRRKSAKWKTIFSRILKGLWEGLISIRIVHNKLKFFIYTILIWSCYTVSIWVACFFFRETMHVKFGTSLAMLIFGTFGIIIAPGGLGAYPYAIQKTLLFYGVSKTIAVALGWLLWLTQFFFTVIFGVLAYIALNIRNKQYEKRRVSAA